MNYLKDYQTEHGLTVDGKIGKHTAASMCGTFGIDPKYFPYFIAQVQHESQNFMAGRENLNYGADALQNNFKKYFVGVNVLDYARKPEKIANRIYANRNGNGDEASGDGWKYRGGGGLQTTGKANYAAFFESVGLSPDTDPEIITHPFYYFSSAVFYFNQNNLWKICAGEKGNRTTRLRKAINLGNADSKKIPLGLDECVALTNQYFKTLA